MGKLLGQRWLIALVVILLLSLIIWFAGPYLAFADHKPLDGVVGRLVAILVLVILWAVWLQIRQLRAQKASSELGAAIAQQPDGGGGKKDSAEAEQLRARFDEAIKSLRSSKKGGRDLYSLPWYVIIGPPGSGKTTALIHSGLRFPLEQKFGPGALRGVGGTRNCDWWFTDEAVLLDTAGRYVTQDSDASADARGWGDFLGLLRRYRGRRPINGVLVAISASDLLSGDGRLMAGHVAAVRHRLAELAKHLGVRVPVYLMITKIDLLAGFVEYFDDFGQDDRKQVWGVTFPLDTSERGEGPARLAKDFEPLLLRIQQRRLERLASENDPRRRAAILAFPAQMAALNEALVPFVNEAFAASSFDAPILLRGVYLTSGTQESTPIDRAIGAVARTFGVDAQIAPRPAGTAGGRAYFIERLLREVVFQEAGLAGINRKVEMRKMAVQIAAYIGCAVLAIGGVVAFWVSYERNVSYLGEVAAAVQKYKDSPAPPSGISGRRLTDALPRLGAARDVATVANAHHDNVPWSMRFWLYRGGVVGAAADDAYLRELGGSLLPVLGEGFQAGLVSMVAEPDKLYEYLKAYMMLGEPKKLDRDQLGALAALEWRRVLPNQPSARADLQEHTTAMFSDPTRLRALVLDRPLVERTQAALANASLPVLMYGRLKLAYAGDHEHAVRFDRVAGSSQVFTRRSGAPLSEQLSAVYTRGAFDDFQNVGRLKLVKQFQEDGWILGASAPPLAAMRDVSDAVMRLYEDDYIHAWDEVIKDVNVRKPKDPRDLEQLLRILGSPASPLKEFMGIVAKNTNFALPVPGAAAKLKQGAMAALDSKAAQLEQMMGGTAAPVVAPGTRITQHFETYNALVAGAPGPAPIDRILQAFGKAANDLAAGASGATPGAKAGQADVLRQLQGEVSLLPPAMGQLVSDVGTGSQEVVSGEVRTELGQMYQQQVVRACREAIAGRYPFEPGAANEVPIDDFARVFGPGGTYDAFFKENLQALVDTSRNPWQWREGAGTAAAVPGLLEKFQAAERIRELFFRPGSATPDVRFTLTPVSMDADATRFVLDLDGHPLEYRHGPIKSVAMQWPSGPTGQASVQFEPMSGGGASFNGAWSLFRLLARAQMQPQSDVRFLLTFSAGSVNAKVQLEAASVRNPFAHPEVLRFKCGG